MATKHSRESTLGIEDARSGSVSLSGALTSFRLELSTLRTSASIRAVFVNLIRRRGL
jgi:hypothetical protein